MTKPAGPTAAKALTPEFKRLESNAKNFLRQAAKTFVSTSRRRANEQAKAVAALAAPGSMNS